MTSIYPNKQGAFYENGSSWHHSIFSFLFFSFLIVSCDKPKEKTVLLPITNTIQNTNVSVKVTKSAVQSIPTGVYTALTFDVETFDTDNMHDNTNPSRLTVNTAGLYIIEGTVAFSNGSGYVECFVRINGSTAIVVNAVNELSSMGYTYIEISTLYNFNQGDYIELLVGQASGSSQFVYQTETIFSMARLSGTNLSNLSPLFPERQRGIVVFAGFFIQFPIVIGHSTDNYRQALSCGILEPPSLAETHFYLYYTHDMEDAGMIMNIR